jgi:hypothetical protein
MIEQQESEIEKLRSRLARLENKTTPRGYCNLSGAALYIGKSTEWLRQQHDHGRGPKRTRRGTRFWSYSYADLDAWMQSEQTAA